MSPWLRFDLVHVSAVALFTLAAIAGLLCAWLGIAFAPVAMPVITSSQAAWLYLWETALIAAALGLALSARNLVVGEWRGLAVSVPADKVRALDEWLLSTNLMASWLTFVVPAYLAALLSVSSWLSVCIVALMGLAARGSIMAHSAVTEYSAARKLPGARSGAFPARWALASAIAITIGVVAIWQLVPTIGNARIALAAPVQREISLVDDQLRGAREDLPVLETAHTEQVTVLTEQLTHEASRHGPNVGQDIQNARTKLLTAQIEALKAVGAARNTLADIERQRLELDARLATINSAAPAIRAR